MSGRIIDLFKPPVQAPWKLAYMSVSRRETPSSSRSTSWRRSHLFFPSRKYFGVLAEHDVAPICRLHVHDHPAVGQGVGNSETLPSQSLCRGDCRVLRCVVCSLVYELSVLPSLTGCWANFETLCAFGLLCKLYLEYRRKRCTVRYNLTCLYDTTPR